LQQSNHSLIHFLKIYAANLFETAAKPIGINIKALREDQKTLEFPLSQHLQHKGQQRGQ